MLPYAASSITGADAEDERIALTAILDLAADAVLTVVNNTTDANSYENSTLTVVKLA